MSVIQTFVRWVSHSLFTADVLFFSWAVVSVGLSSYDV